MPIDYLASVRGDAQALADAARRGRRDAPIAGCPGWDVDALLAHLGRIYQWVLAAVDLGGASPGKLPPAPTDRATYPDWLVAGSDELCRRLEVIDPAAPVWNFSLQPRVAAFWPRRMALETAVHRWDGESALGDAQTIEASIEAALASEGIDEMFAVFAPLRLADRAVELGGSLHVHCTDAEGEWTLSSNDGALVVDCGHAKGDAAVRGPASTLYLMLWRRVPPDHPGLERFGNPEVLDCWLAAGVP